MLTAQFLQVSKGDQFRLTDFSLNGYQSNSYVLTEQGELFSTDLFLYELDSLGVAQGNKEKYYWWDYNNGDDVEPDWTGGHWKAVKNGVETDVTTANDKIFDYATGFWFVNGLTMDDGEKITLTNSGAVAPDDYVYPVAAQGNVIGNAMPTSIKIGSITVDGYQDNTYVLTEQGELFSTDLFFYSLDSLGVAQGNKLKYYWWDYNNGDDVEPDWVGGNWKAVEGGTERDVTPSDDDAIASGDGVWFVNGLTLDGGEVITIELPSPVADHSAE